MHIKIYYGGSLITECNGEDVENMIKTVLDTLILLFMSTAEMPLDLH